MYGDLKCPTVKLFVENYLPSLIDTWVRTGKVKLDYRSLETDTSNEDVFFRQEIAALAAGRQDRMWNFALTFVREQGDRLADYSTEEFLSDIATQVPHLGSAQWRGDRTDALLSRRVAFGVYSSHSHGLRSTPSFLISFTGQAVDRPVEAASLRKEFEGTLSDVLASLQKEADEDFPTLKTTDSHLFER